MLTKGPVQTWYPCQGTEIGVVKTRQCLDLNTNLRKQLGKGINYREIGGKFGGSASTAFEKVNTAGTDENLFRLVPVPGHGTRVLSMELVLVPGHGTRVLPLELVLVPGHGAQISTRGPTKGYVQTGTHARAPCPGTKSEQGLIL